jgi:hypothetical protein
MAAAEVLAPGSTAASSADIVVAALTLLCLKGSANGVGPGVNAVVHVELKDEDGFYWPFDTLATIGKRAILLEAAATYRVTRVAAGTVGVAADYNCGVFTG